MYLLPEVSTSLLVSGFGLKFTYILGLIPHCEGLELISFFDANTLSTIAAESPCDLLLSYLWRL